MLPPVTADYVPRLVAASHMEPTNSGDIGIANCLGTMKAISADEPLFMLVDDHVHSERMMRRTIQEGPCRVQLAWIGDARRAARTLGRLLAEDVSPRPDMVIVDLKASSSATLDFICATRNRLMRSGVPIVALSDAAHSGEQSLIESGADAVFHRQHELDAYRAEIAEIIAFWVRETVAWPIRA